MDFDCVVPSPVVCSDPETLPEWVPEVFVLDGSFTLAVFCFDPEMSPESVREGCVLDESFAAAVPDSESVLDLAAEVSRACPSVDVEADWRLALVSDAFPVVTEPPLAPAASWCSARTAGPVVANLAHDDMALRTVAVDIAALLVRTRVVDGTGVRTGTGRGLGGLRDFERGGDFTHSVLVDEANNSVLEGCEISVDRVRSCTDCDLLTGYKAVERMIDFVGIESPDREDHLVDIGYASLSDGGRVVTKTSRVNCVAVASTPPSPGKLIGAAAALGGPANACR